MTDESNYVGTLYGKRNGSHFTLGITGSDYKQLQSVCTTLKATVDQQLAIIRQYREEMTALQTKCLEQDETIDFLGRQVVVKNEKV